MTLRNKRLGIVVSTADNPQDWTAAFGLARAACNADCEVSMFFMSDAVGELPAWQVAIGQLEDDGCELIACASSAAAAGLGEPDVGMLLGSQDDHAAIVQRADRVVAFT